MAYQIPSNKEEILEFTLYPGEAGTVWELETVENDQIELDYEGVATGGPAKSGTAVLQITIADEPRYRGYVFAPGDRGVDLDGIEICKNPSEINKPVWKTEISDAGKMLTIKIKAKQKDQYDFGFLWVVDNNGEEIRSGDPMVIVDPA
ncbi:hypothetical protein [Microbulbifer elongatus]|uniref:hypothetical protein n=1 Tax=Microbulbifer elongatus TaxID=86173 RepID=UPI001CFD28A2|nr:hypothetical protein [Microbulbifer elongatus]